MKYLAALVLVFTLKSTVDAQQPRAYFYPQQPYVIQTAPVPAGQWVAYRRPTWIGNAVLGPVWVWTPTQ